jgi:hypothetical protein
LVSDSKNRRADDFADCGGAAFEGLGLCTIHVAAAAIPKRNSSHVARPRWKKATE